MDLQICSSIRLSIQKTIEQLIVPQINTTAVNQYVQQLQSFASPLAETHSEARTILITASAIEARMQTADSEYKKANRLGQAFIALQQQSNFTGHLRIINASLTNLKSVSQFSVFEKYKRVFTDQSSLNY